MSDLAKWVATQCDGWVEIGAQQIVDPATLAFESELSQLREARLACLIVQPVN
jgi:hypothetical protein